MKNVKFFCDNMGAQLVNTNGKQRFKEISNNYNKSLTKYIGSSEQMFWKTIEKKILIKTSNDNFEQKMFQNVMKNYSWEQKLQNYEQQDLVFSVKLHLDLIPYPLTLCSLPLTRYPWRLSLIPYP